MQDATGITNYFYDRIGRLTSVTNPYRKMVAYSYDQLNNRLAMTVTDLNSQKQRTINYSYDILNRLSTITEPGNKTTTLNYGPNLRIKEILYANGSKTSYEYNDANWLTRVITNSGNVTVSKYDYTYDAAGNKQTMKDKVGELSNYIYDPLGRLKTVTRNGKNSSYDYDAVGNRIKLVDMVGNTTNYIYDAQNKLQSMTKVEAATPTVTKTTAYTYDSNGNQIVETGDNGSTYYYYDAENRLVRIKYPNSQVPETTSTYNGDGQRVQMSDDLNNTYYLYDGTNVIADTDGTGVIKSYYLRGPSGNLINTEMNNKKYYYATDGQGSVNGITDETGAIKKEYAYDEFGVIAGEQGDIQNPFKFTGAIHDKTSNLYLMGSRYYNPKIGRFITQDSFGADYGADWTDHLYTYTDNNPVNFVDPTGHARKKVTKETSDQQARIQKRYEEKERNTWQDNQGTGKIKSNSQSSGTIDIAKAAGGFLGNVNNTYVAPALEKLAKPVAKAGNQLAGYVSTWYIAPPKGATTGEQFKYALYNTGNVIVGAHAASFSMAAAAAGPSAVAYTVVTNPAAGGAAVGGGMYIINSATRGENIVPLGLAKSMTTAGIGGKIWGSSIYETNYNKEIVKSTMDEPWSSVADIVIP